MFVQVLDLHETARSMTMQLTTDFCPHKHTCKQSFLPYQVDQNPLPLITSLSVQFAWLATFCFLAFCATEKPL